MKPMNRHEARPWHHSKQLLQAAGFALILPLVILALWGVGVSAAYGAAEPLEALVKVREGAVARQAVSTLAGTHRVKIVQEAAEGRLWRMRAPDDAALAQFRAAARRHPAIEYIQPHHLISLAATFPDDLDPLQWSLHHDGQTFGVPGTDIDAPEAWDYSIGSMDVIVAVIDSGMALPHPDLFDNLWINEAEIPGNGLDDDGNGYVDDIMGWNFRAGTNNPSDTLGHGTMVAGVIGARGDNGIGITGVAWRVRLMALNCFGDSNITQEIYLIDAIDYAIANGARIINASWGTWEWSPALGEAVQRASDAGVLFVAAAGNEQRSTDDTPYYPAAQRLPRVLSVGATTQNNDLALYSNWGRYSVHVLAPGSAIRSTTMAGGYGSNSGTSFAAPHVSGVAALLWAQYPGASADFVRGKILGGVLPMTQYEEDAMTPGRLNAHRPFLREASPIPPIGDLRVVRVGYNGAELAFTVPQGAGGEPPFLYDLRVGPTPASASAFFDLPPERELPHPGAPGSMQTVALTGLEPGATYWVAVRTLDDAGNFSGSSNLVFFTTGQPVALFAEDADTTSVSALWTAEGEWHRTQEAAHGGAFAWSTTQGEEYLPNLNMSLISPPIDLSGVGEPVLEFYHRAVFQKSTQLGGDGGVVEVSADGGNSWRELAGFYDAREPWHREQLPLAGAAGRPDVRIRFRFQSDAAVGDRGWLVDSIRVIDGVNWVARPRRLLLQPYRRFGALHPPPYYEETPDGQWRIQGGRTMLATIQPQSIRASSVITGQYGRATMTPFFPAGGRYGVWAAWGQFAHGRNAAFVIQHYFGTDVRYVDQVGEENGDQWVFLGEYAFAYGEDRERGSVALDKAGVTESGHPAWDAQVHWDLVRVELLEQGDPESWRGRIPGRDKEGDGEMWIMF